MSTSTDASAEPIAAPTPFSPPADTNAQRRTPPTHVLRRLFDLDLSQPLAFAALAVLYVASRVPWVDNGYGTKPDAWRIALTGYWLWDKHEFYPSRLPGYPVPELAYASIVKGGWVATNMLTVFISLVGLWFFARIVRHLDLPNRGLLVVGFAFTPLLWINSMNTIDYEWALTFILAAYYFLLTDRPVWSSIMIGLAIGSRIPSAAMLLPFCVYLWRDGKRSEIRTYVIFATGVALLAFSPIVWKYGPSFFNFYDAKVGYRDVIRLLAKDSLGLLGALVLAAAVAVSLPRFFRLPRDFIEDKNVCVWVLAILVVAFTFSRLPHEAAYLIPLFPFAYFVLAKYAHRWVLAAAIVAIVAAGFVDFTTINHEVALSSVKSLRVGQGMLLSNRDTQRAQMAFARDIRGLDLPPNSVVMIGFVYPQFAVLYRDELNLDILEKDKSSISQLSDKGKAIDPKRNITYVWLLEWEDYQKFQQPPQATQFFYTLDAGRSTAALYSYRPGVLGAKLIDIGISLGRNDKTRSQR